MSRRAARAGSGPAGRPWRTGAGRRARVAFAVLLASVLAAWLGPPRARADEPRVNFTAEPERGGVPLTVQFRDTSTDGDGDIVAFSWRFGDGATSTARHPVHTYGAAGKYDVTLTVTDAAGNTGEKRAKDFITVDRPGLVAALLPVSRSVQVGQPATAFVTVINVGAITATGVGLAIHPSTAPGGVPGAPLAAELGFQTTDPVTNQVTGAPGAAADIAPGEGQSFVVALTPRADLPLTDVRFEVQGTNTSTARIVPGLNTLLLSASTEPVADVVAVAAIAGGTPAVELPGPAGAAAFAVAAANVGAGDLLTVSADTGAVALPLALAVCRTEPVTGACAADPQPAVAARMDAGATAAFAVFAAGAGTIAFDPERHRVFVRFRDGAGAVRGATSVAIKTR